MGLPNLNTILKEELPLGWSDTQRPVGPGPKTISSTNAKPSFSVYHFFAFSISVTKTDDIEIDETSALDSNGVPVTARMIPINAIFRTYCFISAPVFVSVLLLHQSTH